MSANTIILVDGNSLIHRAFHATPPMTTSSGELTNAVYAFARMLFRALLTLKPGYAVVAFDRRAPTFRHIEFEDYKAHRPEGPEGLYEQFGRVHELVDVLSFQTCEIDGFEADDVLGTLAAQGVQAGLDVVIVTGDTDALQLVRPGIRVLMPRKGMSDTVFYDTAAVMERYGLEPAQLIDFKALKGDPSDNIPGVPGIGEKTAAKLLVKFRSIEEMLERIGEVDPRTAKALEANADGLVRDRRLVRIVTDAPVTLDLAAAKAGVFDPDRLDSFLRGLEFRIPPNELPPRLAEAPAVAQINMFEVPAAMPGSAAQPGEVGEDVVATIEGESEVISLETLPDLVERLRKSGGFALDVETTGLDPMRVDLVGISVSDQPGRGSYIPVGHRGEGEPNIPREVVLAALGPVFADQSIPKIGHNLKYDTVVLAQVGAPVEGITFDTMIARYLLQSNERSHGLKDVAFFELGLKMTNITELIGKGKAQVSMADVSAAQVAPYASADADISYRLARRFESQLKEVGLWDLFNDVEMPLVPVLGRMEQAGIAIDVPYLKAMSADLGERIAGLEIRIYDLIGHQFNLNSTQQMAKVLFEELKLPSARKTASGGYSTDADTLEELRPMHPVVGLILDYREFGKLKSTYVDALPLMVNPRTNRVHTSYNQIGAATGRISSADPNLQNIPIRTDLGKQVRQAFVASAPDNVLLAVDYSQVELRILAHVTQDPNLIAAFRAGRDIHATTASTIMGVPLGEVTSDQRRVAKTVNFGVLYGMGEFGLANSLNITRGEARSFIDSYFAEFPTVANYLEGTKRFATDQGYVLTLLGRRRYIPEIKTPNRQIRSAAERVAINMPIQGTAADIIKVAMVRIDRVIQERRLASRMLLQVHDELVFEAPTSEVEELRELVTDLMRNAFSMTVPLDVEAKVGKNWQDLH